MLNRVKNVFSKAADGKAAPVVSLVVVVYDMADQAQKTLISMGTDYQQDVRMDEYEVIVVENESPNLINADFIASLPSNIHYYKRDKGESSPVHALNFGASLARGEFICLMIDGARMLTPGVVKNIILGHKLGPKTVVSIPGYHLGESLQQESVSNGYGQESERELIEGIAWPEQGYRLFDIACFSGSCAGGFFLPNSESNCISMPRDVWRKLGGADVRFDLRGGGLINLDIYKRACEFAGIQHVIIPGEGTFHQFHGGVTTGGEDSQVRAAYIEASKEQYLQLRGDQYSSPVTKPIYLGQLPEESQKYLHFSSSNWLKSKGKKTLSDLI